MYQSRSYPTKPYTRPLHQHTRKTKKPRKFLRLLPPLNHGKPPKVIFAGPTDARERQKVLEKKRKEAGIVPQKRAQTVEYHYDDCGEDLSGLGCPDNMLYALSEASSDEPETEPESEPGLTNGLDTWWLHGASTTTDQWAGPRPV